MLIFNVVNIITLKNSASMNSSITNIIIQMYMHSYRYYGSTNDSVTAFLHIHFVYFPFKHNVRKIFIYVCFIYIL